MIEGATTLRALVTGVAGFIGSRLAAQLLEAGVDVVGIDCLTDYYSPSIKARNLERLASSSQFAAHVEDLLSADLRVLLDGVDVVFHLAGQPGVRDSWMTEFPAYVQRNIVVTHRLLEAMRSTKVTKFVYSSSSSIYGDALTHPTPESSTPRPQSPYGVTKLAAEHICGVYARSWDVPTVSLRYFTVFGGGQRPDMAFSRLISAAMTGSTFQVYGTGAQRRDFTHVSDVVKANMAAAVKETLPGDCFNIAGGQSASLRESIALVESLVGRPVQISYLPLAAGDVGFTSADTTRARDLLGWSPQIKLREGLEEQVEWQSDPSLQEA